MREDAGESSDSGESRSVDTALLPLALVLRLPLGTSESGGIMSETGFSLGAADRAGGCDLRPRERPSGNPFAG